MTSQDHQSVPAAGSKKGTVAVLMIAVVGMLFLLGLQIARLLLR